jgi:hypothetical protein
LVPPDESSHSVTGTVAEPAASAATHMVVLSCWNPYRNPAMSASPAARVNVTVPSSPTARTGVLSGKSAEVMAGSPGRVRSTVK